jgi:UPF0489 domain
MMDSQRNRKGADSPTVFVMVIESHQHALEHIHAALRKNKLVGRPWEMIHFDAHPDLACGIFPAKACFVPRLDFDTSLSERPAPRMNLYDLLDATAAGIAEWILPLVLAADLKRIAWIKPSCSNQLPDGQHSFQVGAWIDANETTVASIETFMDLPDAAKVKVDWKTPYYYDDNSVRPSEQLLLSQQADLSVVDLSKECSGQPLPKMGSPWMLDICLDYFGCRNPFLDELGSIDVDYTIYLQELVQIMTKKAIESKIYVQESQEIQNAFVNLVRTIHNNGNVGNASQNLERALGGTALAAAVISEVVAQLSNSKNRELLIQKTMEALGVLAIPHEDVATELVDERLKLLDAYLQTLCQRPGIAPFLVTIARSSNDGFTPMNHVEQLQAHVLQHVHSFVCGCQCNHDWSNPQQITGESCHLKLVFDYGQWEGSTLYTA